MGLGRLRLVLNAPPAALDLFRIFWKKIPVPEDHQLHTDQLITSPGQLVVLIVFIYAQFQGGFHAPPASKRAAPRFSLADDVLPRPSGGEERHYYGESLRLCTMLWIVTEDMA
ncbi:hypothetical protein GLAREA_06596 [Glarea lozoyensis ATCC 20868]|uniref:Uncharacterized protein n=1 Tax=Glarea lozoyensis (strain ATCC 20868 / MF5171) TaxID=1116229 RepID=S3E597_GLAL2|nr:uncharacterized protein GLAREA_06596 [Glarea lozoyensis ATCC 20868]EPE33583.1 hypothetical protein GLAREA_06596 [Glarea lozoyensis ATCC 20868]